jgi:lipid-A-disaccharide synthase
MRYYIVAGERSGDLHGSNLVKALKRYDSTAQIRGFGGDYMREAGVDLAVHYHELAFMGLAEIVFKAGKIFKYIKLCKEDIRSYQPDVVILIDYGGFNWRIAKFCKEEGRMVFHYIPPKVWAWFQRRAFWLKRNVNRIFVILPFEKDFFKKKVGVDVDYVGNPVLDAIKAHIPDEKFLIKNKLDNTRPLVALLPGSRKQELQKIIPVLAEVVKRNPAYQFAVAAVNNLNAGLYNPLKEIPGVRFVSEDTYNLLLHARAAIVTSGTATLETALFNVPQVVVYKTNPVSYGLAKIMVSIPFISLVNLIAGKEVVKELIQGDATEEAITTILSKIVPSGKDRDAMLGGYNEMLSLLDTGSSASDNAARLMVKYLTT